jgi:efflux transporter, RND family, MFP subunit
MIKTKMMIAVSALSLLTVSCGKQKQERENVVKVKTIEASSTSLNGVESYSGTIEENGGVSLSFPVGGTVKQLNVAEGRAVGSGQLIAVLDATTLGNLVSASSATVGQAQAAVGQARAGLAQAEKSAAQALDAYKRMKQLHDNGSLPEIKWVEVQTQYQQAQDAVNLVRQQVSQAEAAVQSAKAQKNISLKNLHDTRLYAPSEGYISKKLVEVGQNVAPGQPVAMLVNIRQVKVKINVTEDDIAKIQVGQEFRFTVSSLSGQTFTARVTEKGVAADPITRSYEVKALAENANQKLLPGMVCDVYVQSSSNASVIALPANIIQIDIDNRPFVWTVVNGVARKTNVTLGESVGNNIQIVGGLSSKDKVIIEGQQKVSNGMKVQ